MSTPDWPSTLPQAFLRDSYGEEGPDNLITSEMSIGPAKTRRRTTSAVYPITGAMHMTSAQLATFKAFVADDIADRATPFTFPDPHDGPDLLVRMKSPYSIAPMGFDWRVSIDLEVLP